MGGQAPGVHSSRSVSTFTSVTLVPALNDQPRRTRPLHLSADAVREGAGGLIGELADQAGVSTKTIRYYEGIGVLPRPRRSDNGYRVYGPADEARLGFVKTAQQLGLSLEDIGQVLALREAGTAPCEHVRGMLREQIRGIGRQLAQLRAMRGELQTLEAAIDQIPAG